MVSLKRSKSKSSKRSKSKSSKRSKSRSSKRSKSRSSKRSKSKSLKSKSSKESKYNNISSPPLSAQDFPNSVKKGNDGNKYRSEADKNGIYRWKKYDSLKKLKNNPNIRLYSEKIKIPNQHRKKYLIHDNGGTPFYVEIYDKEIKIFKEFKYDDILDESIKVFKFFKSILNYEKVFIGKDKAYGYTGNSILVKLQNNVYMYIGSNIYTFKTDEEIIKYESTVGNSDVPYPIAFSKNNVYLMVEYVFFPKELTNCQDEYGVFYGHIKTKPPFDKTKVKKIKNMKIIHERLY